MEQLALFAIPRRYLEAGDEDSGIAARGDRSDLDAQSSRSLSLSNHTPDRSRGEQSVFVPLRRQGGGFAELVEKAIKDSKMEPQ